jgi:hypothetical protein
MTLPGGSSTISGVDFELWFTVYKIVDAIFDANIRVKPQANCATNIYDETIITSIDDLILINDNTGWELYNIKSKAPNKKYWTFSALKSEKILKDFKEQFHKTPDCKLFFVSASPCIIFSDILPRGAVCSNRHELQISLKANKYIGHWDKLKKELEFTDVELIAFAKNVSFFQVPNVAELEKWVNERIKGEITNEINVSQILYQLAKDASISKKTLTQKEIIKYLKGKGINLKVKLRDEELLGKIASASSNVLNIRNTFFENYHIDRNETTLLYDTIFKKTSQQKDRIIILTGIAGSGKSVIIKDLLTKLRMEKTPTLALKADTMMYDSLINLEKNIKLDEGITEIIGTLAEQYGKAIVLIDQIDALSQTLSKDRNILNTYVNLVSQLSMIENVSIVISCREYDLHYDPLLKDYDKNIIKVASLSLEDEVYEVLKTRNIDILKIPVGLKNLLVVPLHLRIFCEIYDINLDLNNIKTLQDLYDELWKTKIESKFSSNRDLFKCIEYITDYMDKNKTLSLPESLLDTFTESKNYLLSQTILILDNKKVLYFHQSFFDYCYSRLFIDKGKSLISEILNQHQGLFIRSQVKQVLSYLRDRLDNKYSIELTELLTNPKVRYHLWLLAVNFLASQENLIDKEKDIVINLIKNDRFCLQFIDSLFSKEWLIFLINQGYLKHILFSGKKNLFEVSKRQIAILANTNSSVVLDFLYDNKSKKKKFKELLWYVFWHLDNWENPKAVNLFINNIRYLKSINEWIYNDILNKLFKFNPTLVCKIFFKDIKKRLKLSKDGFEFDKKIVNYHDTQLFQKLIKGGSNEVLEEALKLIEIMILKSKYKEKSYGYFIDGAFYSYLHFERDLFEHWKWLHLIEAHLIQLAKENNKYFLSLTKKYTSTFSQTMICLLIKCYLTNFESCINESFYLLLRKGLIEDLKEGYYGAHEMRELLNKIYPYLKETQRVKLNKFIISFSLKKENEYYSGERLKWREYPKFELLGSIPKNEIVKYPNLYQKLQELERKFGTQFKNEEPYRGGVFTVGPPLPAKAYEKMTSEQWLKSFMKYDDSTAWDQPTRIHQNDPSKGGIVEHSRVFSSVVKNRPDSFYEFIFELGKKNKVSTEYLAAGLNGLVEANYNLEKIKKIIILYWQKKDISFRRNIIKAIEYIDRNKTIGLDLIKVLEYYSLKDSDPKENDYQGGDALTSGINTVRGAAIFALVKHGFRTNHSKKLFEIFDKVTKDKSIAVKSCLIVHLPAMLSYDRKKTYDIFIKLTKNLHPQLVKYGMECLYYLMTKVNFKVFVAHLRVGIEINDSFGNNPISQYVGQVLAVAYSRDYQGSKELLEEGFGKNENIKIGALDFSIRYLNDPNKKLSDKSKEIFLRFLNDDSINVRRKYGWEMRDFSPESFNSLFSLLKEYSLSKASSEESQYYLEYLLKCCNSEPEKCIDLIDNYSMLEKPDIRYNALQGEEVFRIVVGSYNKLSNNVYKEKAMNILDNIMKDELYKRESQKLIKEVERV